MLKMLTYTFTTGKCVCQSQIFLPTAEGAHAHICQRQMFLPAPEGAHAHICQMQICLPAP